MKCPLCNKEATISFELNYDCYRADHDYTYYSEVYILGERFVVEKTKVYVYKDKIYVESRSINKYYHIPNFKILSKFIDEKALYDNINKLMNFI